MKNFFTTKRLCRAGIIAALYVALTYAFAPLAYGPFQIRPAEAFCILPIFFPEAIPALYIGCMLSNLASPYLFYDVVIGSLATLIAAFSSYLVSRFLKKEPYRLSADFSPYCSTQFLFLLSSFFYVAEQRGTPLQPWLILLLWGRLL